MVLKNDPPETNGAHAEGKLAFQNDVVVADNPYFGCDAKLSHSWELGWKDAENARGTFTTELLPRLSKKAEKAQIKANKPPGRASILLEATCNMIEKSFIFIFTKVLKIILIIIAAIVAVYFAIELFSKIKSGPPVPPWAGVIIILLIMILFKLDKNN